MTESIEWDCVRSRVLKRTKQHTNKARRSNARECESGSGKGESEVKKSEKVLEKNRKKLAARRVPRWSPTPVLTAPDAA